MTFSVKAVDTPSPQLSPFMQPYVSPQILPQPGQRVPAMSLSDEHAPPKRVGTDPTKYKTTICRNWEQTGTCTFRGCTFAHGVEELRPPTRPDHGNTPLLHSQYVSPGNTPPLMATNTATGAHFSAAGGPAAPGGPKLEGLLDLLYGEVVRERELVSVHMEANRTLESMLRREQAQHAETKSQLQAQRVEYATLSALVSQQNELLQNLVGQLSGGADPIAVQNLGGLDERASAVIQQAAFALEKPDAPAAGDTFSGALAGQKANGSNCDSSSSSDAGESKEQEKERIEELLRALQQTSIV